MNGKSIKKQNLSTKLFWMILIAAFLVRIIGLTSVPGGVNQDEAMGAVDAWALSKYGTDRYGMQLPVHFTAWKYSQMSVLLSYCMIPFIKLFGFSTFAVRLPMVLAGTAGVALMYLIGKRLFSQKWSIVIMALTAVNPWQFMQSRWALDCNLFPHIFLLGFYLLLRGLEKIPLSFHGMLWLDLLLLRNCNLYRAGIPADIRSMVSLEKAVAAQGGACQRAALFCGGVAGDDNHGN